MSSSIRQSNLFVAEDWAIIYKSFQQVNFTSYDYDTLRAVLVDHIRINYPEDFNDWIESSEFVAIIDLLAYLGQAMALRMDLNTRENFLDTAESRDSVLRLARMLSYNPQRNRAAFGMLKIDSIKTSEPLIDSENRNLAGKQVNWNSPTNTDWLEQFLLVMNSAFNKNNQFGEPVKKGTVSSISTEMYEFNNDLGLAATYPFSVRLAGQSLPCEVVSADFDDLGSIYESEPDPYAAFRVLYRTDGTGNSSINTGFFLPFKQGTLTYKDMDIAAPEENLLVDIAANNINQTDTWFQEIDASGQIRTKWKQVPTVAPSSNIIFNAMDKDDRDIFTVITRENDNISYKFADGRFGNIPLGYYRAWYRVSKGTSFQIKPQNIQNQKVVIRYYNALNQPYELTLTYSLKYTVGNSTPTESIDDIKRNAPQVYYTQDRMVNGEDYNVFPLIKSGEALKIKATNRTYSGHSRYININDPTGTVQNTNVFADDGIFYSEYQNALVEFIRSSTSTTVQQLVSNYITPAISQTEMRNFVTAKGKVVTNFDLTGTTQLIWRTATDISNASTGYFEQNGTAKPVGTGMLDPYVYIKEDSLINLVELSDTAADGIWVKVDSLTDNGNGVLANGDGKITVNERLVDNNWIVKQVVPVFSNALTDLEKSSIDDQLTLQNTFGIGYDYEASSWYVIEPQDLADLSSAYSLVAAKNKSGTNADASWLMRIEFTSASWRFYSRNLSYIWESVLDVRFFYNKDYRTVNTENGKAISDEIRVLRANNKPDNSGPIESSFKLQLDDSYTYDDGYIEPRRVKVTMKDTDQDGYPDDPQVFEKLVGNGTYIFWKKTTSLDGYEYLVPHTIDESFWRVTTPVAGDPVSPVDNDLVFVYNVADDTFGEFYLYDASFDTWTDVSTDYTFNSGGRSDLMFQWKHYVEREDRIDPAISNIIDMFVLSRTYDAEMRTWIKTADASISVLTKPKPPTTDSLRLAFSDLDEFKMMSDQIIWRPAEYKILFGATANEKLKAAFKVVKMDGSSISDNELKSRIITAVDTYFNIINWNFGESFFYTELAAYIHQQLATHLASIVIVPLNESSSFGNLFQVKTEPNELFLSGATVSDIDIVDNLTVSGLRIGN